MLWNVDLTLVDVARVSRDAYAEAFRRVTGRPLVALPALAGASDSEIFFDAQALNAPVAGPGKQGNGELLAWYLTELAAAFAARRGLIAERGRVLPGARESLAALAGTAGVIQTVLTGSVRQTALEKLRAFHLEDFVDADIGGYGSDAYPKGAQILRSMAMATEKYGRRLAPADVVYVADSVRDAAAAMVGGVRCVGVATGRSTASELRGAGADPVLESLADTQAVIAAVLR